MIKKELLIILILAVLVTGLSLVYAQETREGWTLLIGTIDTGFYSGYQPPSIVRGWPLPFLRYYSETSRLPTYAREGVQPYEGATTFLFWFIVLTAGWWVLKIVLRKIKMEK